MVEVGNTGSAGGSSDAPPTVTTPVVQPKTNLPQTTHQQMPAPKAGRANSIYPIEGLSPYQNNWTIKARVTQKSEIKTWSNQRGEGKLFNVTFMDESGEIRGTAFNLVVDELYPKLEEGKVYFISKARVNLAKKKFSNLTNDYELSLERTTEVEEVGGPLHYSHIIDINCSMYTSATKPPMYPWSSTNSFPSVAWRSYQKIPHVVRP